MSNTRTMKSDIDYYKYLESDMGDKFVFYRSIFEPYNYFKTLIKKKKLPLDGAIDILESIDKNFGKDYYDTEYLICNGNGYLYGYVNCYKLKGDTGENLIHYKNIFKQMIKDDINSPYPISLITISNMIKYPDFRATAVNRNRSIVLKILECFKVRPFDSMIRYKKLLEVALKIKKEWSFDVNNLKVGDKLVGIDIKYNEDTEDITFENRQFGYNDWVVKKITKCYIWFYPNLKKRKDNLQDDISSDEYVGNWYKIENYT